MLRNAFGLLVFLGASLLLSPSSETKSDLKEAQKSLKARDFLEEKTQELFTVFSGVSSSSSSETSKQGSSSSDTSNQASSSSNSESLEAFSDSKFSDGFSSSSSSASVEEIVQVDQVFDYFRRSYKKILNRTMHHFSDVLPVGMNHNTDRRMADFGDYFNSLEEIQDLRIKLETSNLDEAISLKLDQSTDMLVGIIDQMNSSLSTKVESIGKELEFKNEETYKKLDESDRHFDSVVFQLRSLLANTPLPQLILTVDVIQANLRFLNEKLLENRAESAGLLSGKIPEDKKCSVVFNCDECAHKEDCGWCEEKGECFLGDSSGPIYQKCRKWHFAQCSRVACDQLRNCDVDQPTNT